MNDLLPSSRYASPIWLRSVLTAILVAGVFGYGVFLARYISPHAGGSDPSGYLHSARLLSQGRLLTPPRVLPGYAPAEFGQFSTVPLGFVLRPDGNLAPTYPTGYPLQLIAAAGFGWGHAVTVLNLVTALASGVMLYVYCRKLHLRIGSALGGVALLWSCPLFLFSTFLPMSDLSALCWSLAVCFFSLGSRENWAHGLLCGAALSISVLVRPTNILLVVPLVVALGFHLRSWVALGIGGLPGVLFFCFYNWRVYGSAWTTGYGNVWPAFQAKYLLPNLAHFSHWIPVLLTPLITVVVAAPFVTTARQRGLVVLSVWALTLIGFYAFYYHSGETWWYLRFILPAFPALIIATLVVFEMVWKRTKRWRFLAALILTGLALMAANWQLKQIRRLDVLHLEAGERNYPDAVRWAKQNLPDRSLIFCMQLSGALFYYTDFLFFRWEQVIPEKFESLFEAVARQDRPVYAALFPFETPEALSKIGGEWDEISTVGEVTFWQRRPPLP